MFESYITCMYVRVNVVAVSFRVTAAMPSQRHIRAVYDRDAAHDDVRMCMPTMHVSTSSAEYR